MNRYSTIFAGVVIIPVVTIFLIIMNYRVQLNEKFVDFDLDVIVNYSTDAALQEVVTNTSDLGMDYVDFERVNVDPKTALVKFCTIFLDSYGMSLSDENYALVKTKYISAFLVASYDGYYIASRKVINSSGATDLVFTLKQPYLYRDGNNIYALNLGKSDAKLYSSGNLSKTDVTITKDAQRLIINGDISDALMYTMFTQQGGQTLNTIYVPSRMTNITKSNPVEGVTVMAYVSDPSSGLTNKVESFGIGGTRVNHQDFVGCYNNAEGQKVYAYTKYIPSSTNILLTYESPIIAAQHGYYFDKKYLGAY